jgi:hypothetical protein
MGYLQTDSGFTPPNSTLTDDTGTILLTDDTPTPPPPSSSKFALRLRLHASFLLGFLLAMGGYTSGAL